MPSPPLPLHKHKELRITGFDPSLLRRKISVKVSFIQFKKLDPVQLLIILSSKGPGSQILFIASLGSGSFEFAILFCFLEEMMAIEKANPGVYERQRGSRAIIVISK